MDWDALAKCAYAVLLWEFNLQAVPILKTMHAGKCNHIVHKVDLGDDMPRATVELLNLSALRRPERRQKGRTTGGTEVILHRTGMIAPYVPL